MVSSASLSAFGGADMVTRTVASLVSAVVLLCGCTDLTEFDSTVTAGLHVISPSNLTVVQTLHGIDGGSSICVPNSEIFLVATTNGTLLRYNSSTLEQTGVFAVSQPSSMGFFDMIYSPMEDNVYLIGSPGNIIEVDLPDCEVLDIFSVCATPVDLLRGEDRPFLYVADASSETIVEVCIENNSRSRICYLKSAPVCMAADQEPDTLLVGTVNGVDLLTTHTTGAIFRMTFKDTPPMSAVATIPGDTVLCAVMSFQSADRVVTIPAYFPSEPGPGFQIWTGAVPLEGDNHTIFAGRDGIHAYVLSYLGDSVSRLVSYNVDSYSIDGELDLPGYPIDLEVTAEGYILALTTE